MKAPLVCSLMLLVTTVHAADGDDTRQLASLPPAAEATLRTEMRANLLALNEILGLVASGKIKDAAKIAEQELGVSAMGRHRGLPFEARPGPHMPPAMHSIGMDGHRAASDFARIAASGDRDKTIAALPSLTSGCVACHYVYRLR